MSPCTLWICASFNCGFIDPLQLGFVLYSSHLTACFGIRCEGIGKQCFNGECVCKGEEHCENIYKPVCGSDGRLYQSECHADAAICKAPRGEEFTISNRTCEGMHTLMSYSK